VPRLDQPLAEEGQARQAPGADHADAEPQRCPGQGEVTAVRLVHGHGDRRDQDRHGQRGRRRTVELLPELHRTSSDRDSLQKGIGSRALRL
jgi:hypothetical protein